MKLVIDIGNTNIKMGLYKHNALHQRWRIQTDLYKTEDEYSLLLQMLFTRANIFENDIKGVIICSVVPQILFTWQMISRHLFKIEPIVVGPGVKTGLNIKYENPREVGSDRIVNAVAALQAYSGQPLIIIDFGTATTYCYVSAAGHYLGGVITPGVTIATEALYTQAARLPRFELKKVKKIVGITTIEAMQAGAYYGLIGQVEGIVKRLAEQDIAQPLVVATGGLASFVANEIAIIDVVNDTLTLDGLNIIYERNKEMRKNI